MADNCQNPGDKAQKAQKDIREGPGSWYVPGASEAGDYQLTTTDEGKDLGVFDGKPFWSGVVDYRDGKILETHTYDEAHNMDFHHSFYVSQPSQELMENDEAAFFWIGDGKVHSWKEPISDEIMKEIYNQIQITSPSPKVEAAAEMGRVGPSPEPKKEKGWYVDALNAFDQPLFRLDWDDWSAIAIPSAGMSLYGYAWHLAQQDGKGGWLMAGRELSDTLKGSAKSAQEAQDEAYKALMGQVGLEVGDVPVMDPHDVLKKRDEILDKALEMPEGPEREKQLNRLRALSKLKMAFRAVDKDVLDNIIWPLLVATAGIDDGGIGSREMASGDIDVQDKQDRPFINRLFPTDDPSDNRGDPSFRDDENNPVGFDDQKGSESDEWFQKTRYPQDSGRHRMQITVAPEDPQVSDPIATAMKLADEVNPILINPPTRTPGSDRLPRRKAVPTGEGGALGIPGVDGSSPHVMEPTEEVGGVMGGAPAEEEKPEDVYKSGLPASNTVTDEFDFPGKQRGQATRPNGAYQFASVEIFAPVDADDLLLDL